jgi:hypothetical protein
MLRVEIEKMRNLSRVDGMNEVHYAKVNEMFKILRAMGSISRAQKTVLSRLGGDHLAIVDCPELVWMLTVGSAIIDGENVVVDGKVVLSDRHVE